MLIINNRTPNIYNQNYEYLPESIIYNRKLYTMKPQGSSINKPGSKYSPAPVIYNRALFKTGATGLLRSLSGISIIHNPSRNMYKTAFLLLQWIEKGANFCPLFLFTPLFLDYLTRFMYNQNRIYVSSSLGRAKICRYELHFHLKKLIKYYFTVGSLHFITLIESPWSELSNGILVDVWVQKLIPNQPISHCDPHVAASYSFCRSPKKLISSSVSPRRCYNDTVTSFMVWTLCLYSFSSVPGVVGWWCCVLTT